MSEPDILSAFEDATRDAPRLQLDTLRAILHRNAGVEYLRPYLNGADATAESFRRLVPLSSYDDYAPLIRRIADGADPPSALSFDPLVCFFFSSGTSTMSPKLIPFYDSGPAKTASNLAHQASSVLLRRLFPPRPSVNKTLWFLFAGNVTETAGKFKVMPASAFPFHSNGPGRSRLLSMCVSPPEVILASDTHQQMYCHLLCGLRSSDSIDAVRAPYAAGLVRAIRLLETKWPQLCNDIENGSVSSEITDTVTRDAVQELLGAPRPDIATRIREACGKPNWRGILAALWPHLRYVSCVTTGSMEQYYPTLKHYAGENTPLVCGDYFASECAVGLNMDRLRLPELTSFVILPTASYYEFLPFQMNQPTDSETVDISGVQIGKMYEVVVTTFRGLYRYRLGDVIKVVGFHNSSLCVQFITRAPKESGELFTERDLMTAVESFRLMLNGDGAHEERGDMVEYAGFLDCDSSEKHVTIFIEVSKDSMFLMEDQLEESISVLRKCGACIEGCLGGVYKAKKEGGELGAIELSVVSPGSFDELSRVALERGAPASQYKPPKIIRNHNLVASLKASTVLTVCPSTE